ncbi:MAG: LysM peptidoglycan-binding domain-containing protein [Flavobacteriaceae bacterium]|nr:LysM peptidoglycan-binding domain-containing protein [Flavobacteriaceae bacterium]
MSEGKLQKLVIRCFKDEKFETEIKDLKYTALLNPEKYSQSYKTEYKKEEGTGSSSTAPKFTRSLPSDLDLEFLFDRTGVLMHYGEKKRSEDEQKKGVIKDIEDFKKAVFDYNGDEHKPNYLIISWGALLFKGILTDLAIEYKLFKSDGTPIRAIAKVKFISSIEAEKRAAAENNKSPDLTHYRIVKGGDTLPLMTHRIYGDSKYYLEVAKANNLPNFRSLKAGQEIFFPPIVKQS